MISSWLGLAPLCLWATFLLCFCQMRFWHPTHTPVPRRWLWHILHTVLCKADDCLTLGAHNCAKQIFSHPYTQRPVVYRCLADTMCCDTMYCVDKMYIIVTQCIVPTQCMSLWHNALCRHDVHPIPLGVTFSNAVSKLKAQSSNVSFHWNVAKETCELLALSFRKCHPKWDWLYLPTQCIVSARHLYNTQHHAHTMCRHHTHHIATQIPTCTHSTVPYRCRSDTLLSLRAAFWMWFRRRF